MSQRFLAASFAIIALLALLSGCVGASASVQQSAADLVSISLPAAALSQRSSLAQPTPVPSPAPASTVNSSSINPLTGLPVEDPSLLALPPALISVSNFPVTARPQTGLSTSPLVFEIYIGEGMTRFLALFYGDYAKGKTTAAQQAAQDARVGPIRSGRLAYEDVRELYDGFLVMAGAYIKVAQQLNNATTVYGSNPNDINSAGISLSNLQSVAEKQKAAKAPALQGMQFSATAPESPTGDRADVLTIFYNNLNRVQWTYDSASGTYLRAQDKADASGKFYPATDKMTGKQLGFDNVVVLFADHIAKAPTLIDIQLMGVKNNPALLFRDGKVYQAAFKTYAPIGPIRLVDEKGQIIPYKPGNTWFQVVTRYSAAKQTSEGQWYLRFYNP